MLSNTAMPYFRRPCGIFRTKAGSPMTSGSELFAIASKYVMRKIAEGVLLADTYRLKPAI